MATFLVQTVISLLFRLMPTSEQQIVFLPVYYMRYYLLIISLTFLSPLLYLSEDEHISILTPEVLTVCIVSCISFGLALTAHCTCKESLVRNPDCLQY